VILEGNVMKRWLSLVLALAPIPHALAAQGLCGGAVRAPATGGWAEYVVLAPRGQAPSTVRYAIIGGESRAGRSLVRFETRVRRAGKGRGMVTQVLVPGYPYEQSALQEVIVQRDRERSVRWGPALLARARASSRSALSSLIVAGCTGATVIGKEQVTVPAGSFEADHYRNAEAGSDIWVSAEVPFGLVKVTGPEGAGLELLDHGRDARSSVAGEPRPINGAN
jgi:hypothetical protein